MIWDFVDEPIPEPIEDLRGLESNLAAGPFRERLQTLLTPAEIDATARRVGGLCARAGSPTGVPGARIRGRSVRAPDGSGHAVRARSVVSPG